MHCRNPSDLVEETLALDQFRVLLADQSYVEPDRMQVESTPMEKETQLYLPILF